MSGKSIQEIVERVGDSAPNNTSFTIRISFELKKQFMDTCKKNETSSGALIREFMKEYIKEYGD